MKSMNKNLSMFQVLSFKTLVELHFPNHSCQMLDEEFIGLENFQGQKDSDDDSQEEVFGLQGVDSDEEIPDSDDQDDDLSEDDDIAQDEALLEKLKAQLARPDTTLSSDDEGDQNMDMEEAEGGWGKKKRAYYNADDSDEDGKNLFHL